MREKLSEERLKLLDDIVKWAVPNCDIRDVRFLPNTPQHVIDGYEEIKKSKKVYNTAE